MNEQKLIQAAAAGDVDAMLELTEHYESKAKGGGLNDEVGDVISIDDFSKMIQSQDDNEKKQRRIQSSCLQIFSYGGRGRECTSNDRSRA